MKTHFGVDFFNQQCYANAVYDVVVCPSVCLSVCLSQVGVLQKWLNIGSHKLHCTIAQRLDLGEMPMGSPL